MALLALSGISMIPKRALNKLIPEDRRASARAFISAVLNATQRLLPRVTADAWTVTPRESRHSSVATPVAGRTGCSVAVPVNDKVLSFLLRSDARKAYFQREGDESQGHNLSLCKVLAQTLRDYLDDTGSLLDRDRLLIDAASSVDKVIVGRFLERVCSLDTDLSALLNRLVALAGETYENHSVSFGVLFRQTPSTIAGERLVDLLGEGPDRKRLIPLSDGYRTAFVVDRAGALVELRELETEVNTGSGFYPYWARHMCRSVSGKSTGYTLGFALTHGGDILVFRRGELFLARRRGFWTSFHHTDTVSAIADALTGIAWEDDKSQHARALYCLALDVSFRRTGGLLGYVEEGERPRVVQPGDWIPSMTDGLRYQFQKMALGKRRNRQALQELAGLDGATIFDSRGQLVSVGAIVQVSTSAARSGARERAAKALSRAGLSVRVSSDGPMEFWLGGKAFLRV